MRSHDKQLYTCNSIMEETVIHIYLQYDQEAKTHLGISNQWQTSAYIYSTIIHSRVLMHI